MRLKKNRLDFQSNRSFALLLQRESLKKLSDDLTRRIAELRDNTARAPTDGTERTSRVRALERELNKVLDENNVRLLLLQSIFIAIDLSFFSAIVRRL